MFFCSVIKTPKITSPQTNLAFIHYVNHCALICTHHLFSIGTAFMLLNEITVEVVLIDRLSLPCNNIAIIQIILTGTPFQILGTIVGLDLVLMIYDQPLFVAWNEVESHKSMNFIMGIVPVPIAQTYTIISVVV